MKAIFVDGAGHTREQESDGKPYHHFAQPRRGLAGQLSFPIDAPPPPNARFDRIGSLPDGRLVYGQNVANLSLWQWTETIDTSLVAHEQVERSAASARELQAFLQTMGRPVVILYDETITLTRSRLQRHIEGVGRKLEAVQ